MKITTCSLLLSFVLVSGVCADDFASDFSCELLPGVRLVMHASRFNPSKHTIRKIGHDEVIIDGHQVFGMSGVPKTQLDNACVIIHGRKIPLEISCLYDPSFSAPGSEEIKFRYEPQGYLDGHHKMTAETFTGVKVEFGDGEGAYSVEWRVVGDTSLRVNIQSNP
jgi:hypothetical protein